MLRRVAVLGVLSSASNLVPKSNCHHFKINWEERFDGMLKRFFGSGKKDDAEESVLQGQDFLPPVVQLNGIDLVKNGVGTRKRFGIAVYRMAVYLPRKTQTAATAINMPGAKQVRLVALRNISGDTLASAFLNGIRKNTSAEDGNAYLQRMGEVIDIFRTQESVSENQTFHMDLLPESGAFFYINEELKGKPIHAAGFNEAILSIWLGDEPADANLKATLLAG